MERVEINKDLTRSEPIREVRQTKDTRTGEATKKQFVAELEEKLARKKKKKRENKKDEIILHDKDEKKKNKTDFEEKEKNNRKKELMGSMSLRLMVQREMRLISLPKQEVSCL